MSSNPYVASYLEPDEQVAALRSYVMMGGSFFHTRYNDGEAHCMFELRPPSATTSGEHHHLRDLGRALVGTFTKLGKLAAAGDPRTDRMIIGSYWFNEAERHHPDPKILGNLATKLGMDKLVLWGQSDLWYNTVWEQAGKCVQQPLLDLLAAIRDDGRPVVLVGNHTIADARHCLNARFVEVPRVDAWHARNEIVKACGEHRDAIFIWCAGMPGKVLAYRVWDQYPESAHLDAGHLFDGVFGVRNRAWLQRAPGAHLTFYQDVFTPFVRSAIP